MAKTFAGLSTTIIATRRRPVLILHLEAKYTKIDCKNEIYAKNWVRSTWTAKVNSCKKSTVKVNGQQSANDVTGDVSLNSGQRVWRVVRWRRKFRWRVRARGSSDEDRAFTDE